MAVASDEFAAASHGDDAAVAAKAVTDAVAEANQEAAPEVPSVIPAETSEGTTFLGSDGRAQYIARRDAETTSFEAYEGSRTDLASRVARITMNLGSPGEGQGGRAFGRVICDGERADKQTVDRLMASVEDSARTAGARELTMAVIPDSYDDMLRKSAEWGERGYSVEQRSGFIEVSRSLEPTEEVHESSPINERMDVVVKNRRLGADAGELTMGRGGEGETPSHCEYHVMEGRLKVAVCDIGDGMHVGVANEAIVRSMAEEAQSRDLNLIELTGLESDVPPHPKAVEGDDGVWTVRPDDVEGWDAYSAETANRAVHEIVQLRPGNLDQDELASSVELLPHGRYEERVEDLGAQQGLSPTEIENLKSGCAGFYDRVSQKAYIRWNGEMGELSTLCHEIVHAAQDRAIDSGAIETPAVLYEGDAESFAQFMTGPSDRLGRTDLRGENGARYKAIFVRDGDGWDQQYVGRQSIAVSSGGRWYEAVPLGQYDASGREAVAVKVDGSYPAPCEAVTRMQLAVGLEVWEEALRSGDPSELRSRVDANWGEGAFDRTIDALGETYEEWSDPSRVSAVRAILPREMRAA